MASLPTDLCPVYAPFFGVMGVAAAVVFTGMLTHLNFRFYVCVCVGGGFSTVF